MIIQSLTQACSEYREDLEERASKVDGLEKTFKTLLEQSAAMFANGVPALISGDFDDMSSMTSGTTAWTTDSTGKKIKKKKPRHSKPSPKLVALTAFADILPRKDFQEELGAALRVLVGLGTKECVLCARETHKSAKKLMDKIPSVLQVAKKLCVELDKEMACTNVRKMNKQQDPDDSHMAQFATSRTTILGWTEQDWTLDFFF